MWNVVTQYSIHWWLLLFKPKLVGGLCTQENTQLQRNWLTPENARKPNMSLFLVKSPLLIWQRQPIFTWQNQILKAVECHFSRLHCCWWNTSDSDIPAHTLCTVSLIIPIESYAIPMTSLYPHVYYIVISCLYPHCSVMFHYILYPNILKYIYITQGLAER